MTHYLDTELDAEARTQRADRATAEARARNDATRDLSPPDYTDEIDMLRRALAGDLTGYTPAGVATMRGRLDWLRGLTVVAVTDRRAAA